MISPRWYGLLFSDDAYKRIRGFLLWGPVIIAVTWLVAFFCLPDGIPGKYYDCKETLRGQGLNPAGRVGVEMVG